MTVDWSQLLRSQDIHLADGRLDGLDDPAHAKATLTDGAVMPLLQHGVIRVTGADAAAFLHAQLTQAIDDLDDVTWRTAGYCNPKGRLHALITVLLCDEGYLLLTHRGLVEPLLRRLRLFVLRSKVTLEDVTDEHAVMGVVGRAALDGLDGLVGSVPEGGGRVHRAGDLITLALGGDPDRLLVLASGGDVPGVWETLSREVNVVDPSMWTLLDIRAGLPQIHPETTEAFVPQQVNLELVEGVNFRKGCYPGQEVVARMHYRGTPSRRMHRMAGPEGPVPAPGSKLETGDGGQAGDVVCAANGPEGLELLAVVREAFRDRQDLRVGEVKLAFAPLPYAV